MARQKLTEITEDKLVAEIYEKVRSSDGKRFYDTVIRRRYYDDAQVERRTSFFQKRDMQSIHVLAVAVERYISGRLWQDRSNRDAGNDAEQNSCSNQDIELDTDESFLEG